MDRISLIRPLTENQSQLINQLTSKTVILAYGSAGTGKTLCGLNYGIHGLSEGFFDRVIYCRPDVSTDFQRGRGSLPGELKEKSLPLLAPLLDNLEVAVGGRSGLGQYLIDNGKIEYVYLEDLRGRSFRSSFVILDEAQNATVSQVYTALTRIGKHSKIFVCGDTSQVDVLQLRVNNGLIDAVTRLVGCPLVGITQFNKEDSVRNKVLQQILEKYEV